MALKDIASGRDLRIYELFSGMQVAAPRGGKGSTRTWKGAKLDMYPGGVHLHQGRLGRDLHGECGLHEAHDVDRSRLVAGGRRVGPYRPRCSSAGGKDKGQPAELKYRLGMNRHQRCRQGAAEIHDWVKWLKGGRTSLSP